MSYERIDPPFLSSDVASIENCFSLATRVRRSANDNILDQEAGTADTVIRIEEGDADSFLGREVDDGGCLQGKRFQNGLQVGVGVWLLCAVMSMVVVVVLLVAT